MTQESPVLRVSRIVLAGSLLLGAFTVEPRVWAAGCESSVPYVSGKGGYAQYRIPAVVRTWHGTLLAFAEGRHSTTGDSGDIDVVLRRSTDGGCTWDPLRVVADGKGNTRGNPAPVVDPASGDVVLVTSYNDGSVSEDQIMRGQVGKEQSRRVFVQRSRDDGRHFTRPHEITAQVKPVGWRWYATGPGHAVAIARGPHRGRLVVAADHSAAPRAGSPDTGRESKYYGGHAIYSDDHGRSWRLGFVDDSYTGHDNANETTAAELPDGRLYFNARDQNGSSPGNRLDAWSSDGAETLDARFTVQPTLREVPVVEGSVLQLPGAEAPLLFSAPSVPTARKAMALWTSTDEGITFERLTTLSGLKAAYSDLVQVAKGTVGVLYETGTRTAYDTIEFRRLKSPG
ncbi:sialidase family protein [Streptomyces sp. NPDC006654]|uniref:sialidase family protein n=1 Tax=Streptomyces sp. NPDC006654 TaxID=3156897 RepID=UPI0033F046DE